MNFRFTTIVASADRFNGVEWGLAKSRNISYRPCTRYGSLLDNRMLKDEQILPAQWTCIGARDGLILGTLD